jgi:hypothetical protein
MHPHYTLFCNFQNPMKLSLKKYFCAIQFVKKTAFKKYIND